MEEKCIRTDREGRRSQEVDKCGRQKDINFFFFNSEEMHNNVSMSNIAVYQHFVVFIDKNKTILK